nr:uncharacterized protein LOC128687841 [Cherax quadricarinatus]
MNDNPPPYSSSPFPYTKLVEESAPPLDELCMTPPNQQEFDTKHHHDCYVPPQPQPHPEVYPSQPSAPPVINIYQQPQPTVGVVVTSSAVPPGICTVCRIGKIKNSASFWSWCCCILCLPLGIIPGIIAFFYVKRQPKCNHCSYTI